MNTELEWPIQQYTYEEVMESREEHDHLVAELLTACRSGDLSEMTAVLEDEDAEACSINANCFDNDDTTPLQVAAANGHVSLVEALLSRNGDPILCNQFGWTPLMHAAYHGHVEVVETFVKTGVNVSTQSFLENCPLKLAARGGHAGVVSILLDRGSQLEIPICSAISSDYNLTPLMVATFSNHDDVVRIMLEKGADANGSMRPTGMTVLMLSVLFAELTTAQMLLNKGADPEATNALGQTAYDLAVASNRRDMVALLEPYTKGKQDMSSSTSKNGIMEAIYEGNKNSVDAILNSDPSMADYVNPDDGSTPLIIASMLGRLDIVATLISHGASLDRQDEKAGWTALMQATYHGKPAVAKYLINHGANVNLKSYDGYNAFDLAAIVQMSDDGGLLSLLAYRIAEQDAVRTHKSRHFLKFLFGGQRSGEAEKKFGSPSKPMNWWRKFKSRFRRGVVSSIRRSTSVANFHSTVRTRASLSGHEMSSVGDLAKTLKNSSFYSCDDLLRVQSLRRSSLDSAILCRVNQPGQQQALKLAAATLAPRRSTIVSKRGISPIPPFCAPPSFTIDMPKEKTRTAISAIGDVAKGPRLASTISGRISSSSTVNSAGLNAGRIAGSSTPSVDKRVTTPSPPATDSSCVGKTGSDCSSSWNDQRSLASVNAARLGTGKPTPLRAPLSRKPSNTPLPIPLPKRASSACDLSLPLRRVVAPSQTSVSASSSGSTAANAGAAGYRLKRPQALYICANNVTGSAYMGGGRKPRGPRVLRRPHSYHDAAVDGAAAAYGMPFPGAMRKLRTGATPSLNLGRPCSYRDPVANSSQTLNDLPITPTRKSFNFFASDGTSSFHAKCSSTPHLAASLSNSSGRSSVITPIWRPAQYAVSPTNFISPCSLFFPGILRDGKDFIQQVLCQLSLEKYVEIFQEQEVDMETFFTLTEADLKDLGITDPSDRKEILVAARAILNHYVQSQRRFMNDVREVQNEREDDPVP